MATMEREKIESMSENITEIRSSIEDIKNKSRDISIDGRKLNIERHIEKIEREINDVEYSLNYSLKKIKRYEEFTTDVCEKCGERVSSWGLLKFDEYKRRYRIGNFHTTKIMDEESLIMLEGMELDDIDEIICLYRCNNTYHRGDRFFDKIIEKIKTVENVKKISADKFNTRPNWHRL